MYLVVLLIAVVGGVVAGAAMSSALSRRSLASSPGSFRCWLGRPVPAGGDRIGAADRATDPPQLRGRALRAVWVHDALVVVGGRLVTTIRPLAVRFADGEIHRFGRPRHAWHGGDVVVLMLELDDGSRVPLAAARSAAAQLAGPYLAALMPRGTGASVDRPGS